MNKTIIQNSSNRSWTSKTTQMILTEYIDGVAQKPIHLKNLLN